ncbi:MAG TPA: fatty acid desaturase [Gammaproteobacteria bacterium]|nr:fatty acid desaturase [Gammaproteobacteria bacterium]
MSPENSREILPLHDARRIVRDLFEPKPWLYWTDFLFHLTLAWAAFAATLWAAGRPLLQVLACLVCVLAMYRAVIFIHELAHLKRGTFGAFRLVWNVLCGCLLLVPSYTYSGVHNHHHRRNVYGTGADGEYLPFATRMSPWAMVGFVAAGLALPAVTVVRFVALTPFGWASPRVRRFLWERVSSLTIDVHFRRGVSDRDERGWWWQEALAFAYGAAALALAGVGVLPWRALGLWYLVAVAVFSINAVRTLAAHRYRHAGDRPMTISEQFLDSVDVPGNLLLTALWAPVGLRYHATHHLFPGMPYHNLGAAYRRLVQALPQVYPRASRGGLWDALRRIWHEARASRRADVSC